MAIIKGNAVANATSYELYEVTGGGYTLIFENCGQLDYWKLYINGELVKDAGASPAYSYKNVVTVKMTGCNGGTPFGYFNGEEFTMPATFTLTKDSTISDIEK